MKHTTILLFVAGCVAFPLLIQPVHAQSQWAVLSTTEVPGRLVYIESPANGGSGTGSPGDPGVNGTGDGAGTFVAFSESSGSSSGASSDYEYGDQWKVTYTWTGSGLPGYPVLVSVEEEADGVSQGTIPAFGSSSSSAQGGDSNYQNKTNPQPLGGSCAVGGDNYYDPYNKPATWTVIQLPPQDGPNPSIVVTISAKSGGSCIQVPPGVTANVGSYKTNSNCQVNVNNPQ